MFKTLIVIFISLVTVHSFKSTSKVSSKNYLVMNLWNVQKVGQSVVDTSSIYQDTAIEAPKTFKRIQIGQGFDERPLDHGITDEQEKQLNYASISNIDKLFRQKTLLYSLKDDSLSLMDKHYKVQLAATYENLLPSTLSTGMTMIMTSKLDAGGLFKDFDF